MNCYVCDGPQVLIWGGDHDLEEDEDHNPEPIYKYPERCCNVCNEKVVLERIKEMKYIKDMFE